MKVNVKADGTVELEVSNGEGQAAIDLIHALQADARRQAADAAANVSRAALAQSGGLNSVQYQAWEVLCENDCVVGVTVAAIARELKIKHSTASQRLLTLVKLGYAERVATGRYRAVTP